MKKLSKKLLSIFLAMLMIVSVIPAGIITVQAKPILYWPVPNHTSLSPYRKPALHDYHAIDIQDKKIKGANVVAAIGGTVYRKSTHSHNIYGSYDCSCVGQGTGLVIKGTDGRYYEYSHMKANSIPSSIKKGSTVYAGQKIGQVGNTGNSAGAHLHFGITNSKKWWGDPDDIVNPKKEKYEYIKEPIVKPKKTTILTKETNYAAGKNVTVNWSKIDNAKTYRVWVNGKLKQEKNATSYSFTTSGDNSYYITVKAKNPAGESDPASINIKSYKFVIALFIAKFAAIGQQQTGTKAMRGDNETTNILLSEQTVNWGEDATPPQEVPELEGYTFTGWDKSYNNITEDTVITATFKPKTFTVKFIDKEGKPLSIKDENGNDITAQKVEYGQSAIVPLDTNTPDGWEFLGWDSQDYQFVNKNLTIQGVYVWSNKNIPVDVKNASVDYQDEGYYVHFDLKNNADSFTPGRAVVSLKTSEDKLIYSTESAAFGMQAGATKTDLEVYVPCKNPAKYAEVIIVPNWSLGVPLSPVTRVEINQDNFWSPWVTEVPADYDGPTKEQEEYCYRDKQFKDGNTSTMDGWIQYGERTAAIGNWSAWQDSAISAFENESTKREIQTQKADTYTSYYHYYRWTTGSEHAYWGNYKKGYDSATGNTYTALIKTKTTSALSYVGKDNGNKYYRKSCDCSNAKKTNSSSPCHYWYMINKSGNLTNTVADCKWDEVTGSKTQYRYRDTNYTYHFYKWSDWTEWSTVSAAEDSNREIDSRTVYSYKTADEDTSGEWRIISGTLDASYANKKANLFVYKVDEASDYSNEYVGQTVIGEDGSYSFDFKLREEPTEKTGDYTVSLGIEGATDVMVIDTIKAPVPKYEVKFFDFDGKEISKQLIEEGSSAVVPELPEKEGYIFTTWERNTTNVKEDIEVHPIYTKNKYHVVFINFETQTFDVKEFEYGDPLLTPEVDPIEGYNLAGWEGVDENTVVTQNMVLTAKYEKEVYTVNFYDFDGNVINTQNVEYGEAAVEPELQTSEGVTFLGWKTDYEDVTPYEVTVNLDCYPKYEFEETTSKPEISLDSGVYDDEQVVTITCEDENAVIYYTTDGTEPQLGTNLYTAPVTIKSSCELKAVASSLGKNDSDVVTNYYCINNPNISSDWYSFDELPQNVIDNFDRYTVETDTGYRYLSFVQASDNEEANELEANGWGYVGSEYNEWSDWQDEEITDDGTKPNLEIETREVEDENAVSYKYSHYKYFDDEGNIAYSKTEVDDYDCEYEEIILSDKLSAAGIENPGFIIYYKYNDERWYSQTKISGTKIQYRFRYTIEEYSKWTPWTTDAPSNTETREYEESEVFRYYNKNCYIVNIYKDTLDSIDSSETQSIIKTYIVLENDKVDISEYDNIDGYNLEGVYLDSEYETAFDLNTPVTESLNLYIKYSPKVYTVTFQYQDGTEIDTQQVDYMDDATAPDVFEILGYKFVGWDKDYESVTEDLVVTAKYLEESQYAYISLDKNSANMYQQTSLTLNATISPSDLSDEEILWNSSDSSVANVNENGVVTAISKGTATITVKVLSSGETASCDITVAPDVNSDIMLITNTSLNYDLLGYLRRIGINTNTASVSDELQNDSSKLKYFNINGVELGAEDIVGTGTTIQLMDDDDILDSKTIVVTGDMTGDGAINNRDVAMFNRNLVGKVTVEEYQELAVDVNGDGYINNRDAAMIARYLVGKDHF